MRAVDRSVYRCSRQFGGRVRVRGRRVSRPPLLSLKSAEFLNREEKRIISIEKYGDIEEFARRNTHCAN